MRHRVYERLPAAAIGWKNRKARNNTGFYKTFYGFLCWAIGDRACKKRKNELFLYQNGPKIAVFGKF